jgi:3-methyladenine DNA glycosylase/8-oxoguanine DNA glycosylase
LDSPLNLFERYQFLYSHLCITHDPNQDEFTGAETAASIPAVRDALHDLFHLDTPLAPLVAGWAAADARLQGIALSLPGLRVLRQEPVECLFSFIVRFVESFFFY